MREWEAYEDVTGPFGGERLDHLAAMLAQRITAMLSSSTKQPPISDFMPSWYQTGDSQDG